MLFLFVYSCALKMFCRFSLVPLLTIKITPFKSCVKVQMIRTGELSCAAWTCEAALWSILQNSMKQKKNRFLSHLSARQKKNFKTTLRSMNRDQSPRSHRRCPECPNCNNRTGGTFSAPGFTNWTKKISLRLVHNDALRYSSESRSYRERFTLIQPQGSICIFPRSSFCSCQRGCIATSRDWTSHVKAFKMHFISSVLCCLPVGLLGPSGKRFQNRILLHSKEQFLESISHEWWADIDLLLNVK